MTLGALDTLFCPCLTSVLDGSGLSTPPSGHFTLGKDSQ